MRHNRSSTSIIPDDGGAQLPGRARLRWASTRDGPYQVSRRPLTSAVRARRERLGPVVGGEDVGLVGQQHDVDARAVEVRQVDVRDSARRASAKTLRQPSRATRSPVKVSRPDRHPRVAPDRARRRRRRGSGTGPHHSRARRDQPGGRAHLEHLGEEPPERVERRGHRLDVGDPDAVRRRSRSRRTSSSRFSSLLATTRSGARAAIARGPGSWCPEPVAPQGPLGWVHQSVAPTSRSGHVVASASVIDGTSDTTRRGGVGNDTAYARSSASVTGTVVAFDGRRAGSDVAAVLAADLEEGLGDLLERAHPRRVHQHVEDVAALDRDAP